MMVELDKIEKALEIGHKAGQANAELEEVKQKVIPKQGEQA